VILNRRSAVIGAGTLIATGPAQAQDDADLNLTGRIGMTGRAIGPHLCWRMKWRDRNLDPSLMVST
jgi:hypothetical protein